MTTQRCILISHAEGETDDRVSRYLASQGLSVEWYTPFAGQSLPELTDEVAATVVYGGAVDVHQKAEFAYLRDELAWVEACLKNDVPTLGLCLGAQMMADVLGVHVGKHPNGRVEYGYYPLLPTPAGENLFPEDFMVLEAHWEGWFELPDGAVHLASTEHFPQQSFRYGDNAYAFQFHPEAHRDMLARWIARRNEVRSAKPGSHPMEKQLADCDRYDAAVEQWLRQFLSAWCPMAQTHADSHARFG